MTREPLAESAKRWAKALKDSQAGPLVVAKEIVAVAARWDTFPKNETKGLDPSQWTIAHVNGQRIKWFADRAAVAERIMARGGDAITSWHHETAIWCSRFKTDAEFKRMCDVLTVERKTTGKVPTVSTAQRLARDAGLIAKRRPRVPVAEDCARCRRLEQVLTVAGLKIPPR